MTYLRVILFKKTSFIFWSDSLPLPCLSCGFLWKCVDVYSQACSTISWNMSVSTAKNGLGRHAPNQLVLIKPPLSPSLALYYKDVPEEMKRYSVFMASTILHNLSCMEWVVVHWRSSGTLKLPTCIIIDYKYITFCNFLCQRPRGH